MSSLLRRGAGVHELTDDDLPELIPLVDADPIVNAVLASRIAAIGTPSPRHFGGDTIGLRDDDGRLVAAAFCGGNLLPVGGGAAEWTALARAVRRRPRGCSSIVGRAEAVRGYWEVLEAAWGPPRAMRADQPLLLLDTPVSGVSADARVTTVENRDLEAYLPAAAAMFAEELGVSPLGHGGDITYRRRVAALIRDGRAFGILDAAGVVFKADVGAVSAHTCQVQGVWVRPGLRGQGVGTGALATVFAAGLQLAPTVSLYVNHFNLPARRMYDRLGMREVARLATILF